jgi:hypothetical protein
VAQGVDVVLVVLNVVTVVVVIVEVVGQVGLATAADLGSDLDLGVVVGLDVLDVRGVVAVVAVAAPAATAAAGARAVPFGLAAGRFLVEDLGFSLDVEQAIDVVVVMGDLGVAPVEGRGGVGFDPSGALAAGDVARLAGSGVGLGSFAGGLRLGGPAAFGGP